MTIIKMIVMIMKMIVIIKKTFKQTCEKSKTNKISRILSIFLQAEDRGAKWANEQTETLRNQSNQCESVPHSRLSLHNKQQSQTLHRHVCGVTATLPRCFNTTAEQDE